MAKTPFNLDALERENAMERFPITHAGKTYELIAPEEYDYSTALAIGEALQAGRPADALSVLLDPKDRASFFKKPLPLWKVQQLLKAYNENYGLDSGE
jgi:hypothetical protein